MPPIGRGRPARPQRVHGGSSDEASYSIKMCGGAARGHPTQAGDRNGAAVGRRVEGACRMGRAWERRSAVFRVTVLVGDLMPEWRLP